MAYDGISGVKSQWERDLDDLVRWRADEDVGDPAALERRLLGRLGDVPSDLHYGVLELIGDGATTSQVVSDEELYRALVLLAESPNAAASATAAAMLFRDFEDVQYLDRVTTALSNTENPGFFDALFVLTETMAGGRIDARRILDGVLNDGTVDADAKVAIAAAIERVEHP